MKIQLLNLKDCPIHIGVDNNGRVLHLSPEFVFDYKDRFIEMYRIFNTDKGISFRYADRENKTTVEIPINKCTIPTTSKQMFVLRIGIHFNPDVIVLRGHCFTERLPEVH